MKSRDLTIARSSDRNAKEDDINEQSWNREIWQSRNRQIEMFPSGKVPESLFLQKKKHSLLGHLVKIGDFLIFFEDFWFFLRILMNFMKMSKTPYKWGFYLDFSPPFLGLLRPLFLRSFVIFFDRKNSQKNVKRLENMGRSNLKKGG